MEKLKNRLEIESMVEGSIKYIKEVNSIDKSTNNGYSIVGSFISNNVFNTDKLYFIESHRRSSNKYTYIYYYIMYYVNDDFVVEEIENNTQVTRVYGGKPYLTKKNIYSEMWGAIENRLAN